METPVVVLTRSDYMTVIDKGALKEAVATIINCYMINPVMDDATVVIIARRLIGSGHIRRVGSLTEHGARIANDMNTPSGQRLLLAIVEKLKNAARAAANA
jgi:hypothetical protein